MPLGVGLEQTDTVTKFGILLMYGMVGIAYHFVFLVLNMIDYFNQRFWELLP
jgi:hypothetical protein